MERASLSGGVAATAHDAHGAGDGRHGTAVPITGELRLLRYFVAVAEELHFGRAAKRLGIAQPPLSNAIRTFERQLGVELFRRTSRSVALTAAGETLLRGGRRVLAVYAETLADIDVQARSQKSRLRVGFDATTVAATTGFVRAFRSSDPQIELDLRSLAWGEGAASLADGTVDVAIVRLPVDDATLACQPLFRETRVAVVHAQHPLAVHRTLTLAQLQGETLVLPRGTLGGWDAELLIAPQLTDAARSAAPAAASVEELIVRVAACNGIGVLPESLGESLRHAGFVEVPVSDAPPSIVALVWRRNGAIAPVRRFVQTAVDACTDAYRAAG
ncbi:MAG TPA: LysR substrate-binding domain-containing protein [Solirubrobacteraceae bacterium]|jgi:DNA-binding transcriptional LysR family regulator